MVGVGSSTGPSRLRERAPAMGSRYTDTFTPKDEAYGVGGEDILRGALGEDSAIFH